MKFGSKIVFGCVVSAMLMSCDPTVQKPVKKDSNDSEKGYVSPLSKNLTVSDSLKTPEGIVIRWFKHGKGATLKRGSVYYIDYKVFLDKGDIIDGNHLLKKDSIPFPIGFQMQGKGWDLALSKLRSGDYVEIFLPSKLARGDKEIKGLIPANSNNTIKIHILSKMPPTRTVDGNKVWLFEENKESKLLFDENEKIIFHTMNSTPSNPRYVNTFRDNKPFEMRLADYGTIPGLKKALINAKTSDRMFIYVPSSEAYGNKGYLDVVKPNEDLFFNVMVMEVSKN
jgi:FKBP-type peptidyl-prolyl cis-trans isomerase